VTVENKTNFVLINIGLLFTINCILLKVGISNKVAVLSFAIVNFYDNN